MRSAYKPGRARRPQVPDTKTIYPADKPPRTPGPWRIRKNRGVEIAAQTRSCRKWSTASWPSICQYSNTRPLWRATQLHGPCEPATHTKVTALARSKTERGASLVTRPLNPGSYHSSSKGSSTSFPTWGGSDLLLPSEIPASHKPTRAGTCTGRDAKGGKVGPVSPLCRWVL